MDINYQTIKVHKRDNVAIKEFYMCIKYFLLGRYGLDLQVYNLSPKHFQVIRHS